MDCLKKKVNGIFHKNALNGLNPLWPGVSDPGKILGGGPKDPQLSFGFSGFLYAP